MQMLHRLDSVGNGLQETLLPSTAAAREEQDAARLSWSEHRNFTVVVAGLESGVNVRMQAQQCTCSFLSLPAWGPEDLISRP